MNTGCGPIRVVICLLAAVALAGVPWAHADVVSDANEKAAAIASRHPSTPIAVRTMAIVQVSVFDAVNAISGRYPALRAKVTVAPGVSLDTAVASATRTALLKLMPTQQVAIEGTTRAPSDCCPTASRRRVASPSVSRRRRPSWPRARTMGRSRPTRTDRTPLRSVRADGLSHRPSGSASVRTLAILPSLG